MGIAGFIIILIAASLTCLVVFRARSPTPAVIPPRGHQMGMFFQNHRNMAVATRLQITYNTQNSGVTPLGSGWANPRAPGLGGQPSEGENMFF